ncbi:MAG: 3',5'-cyclic-AMP phosphodiesterase [Mojavia pulchra JT2-VF2]|jgi:Icc protein|uniref:3',5'-cyclic-AMP phosphodiesterase n=1 Tax=Mojavia pulchra JT2-VF2 TaxID=287848 RepID=A0A951Q3C3_9NOST|nr:3',5'-cyclic-AMP phosphodiesterase [Mojavia pulchra JT2-VF2]
MNQVSPISIVQITDMHLFAAENHHLVGIPTRDSFQAVIERLKDLQPELDLLLLTGDLSGDGTVESYENLQNLLSPLKIPTYWVPGNHDCAIAMDEILNLGLLSRRKSFERGKWNFILLNSSVPECVHGHLSAETLNWLDSQLKILSNYPTVIALHHPPFLVNSEWLDSSTLQNPEELFAILDNHPQVKLVLCGHIHQEFEYQRHNVHYLGTPSTCIQFKPKSATFALEQKPPGFRLLKLYPDGNWETWVERVSYFHPVELKAKGY